VGLQRLGREIDHSSPSGAKVKNEWSCRSVSPIRLHVMHKNNLILLLAVQSGIFLIINGIDCVKDSDPHIHSF
jgi:hypothetical protein